MLTCLAEGFWLKMLLLGSYASERDRNPDVEVEIGGQAIERANERKKHGQPALV